MTTLYILRHSQPLRNSLGEYNSNEFEQIRNEKNILSVLGEERAKKISEKQELKNIDILYSSHYVRSMSTAKYIAEQNNIKLNVDERLGERKFGVNSMNELPKDFFEHQFFDWDYKIDNGESLNEVFKRMQEVLEKILKENQGKNIAIVSHGTALSVMLKKYCDIIANNETKLIEIYFKGRMVFDGNWECPELFRLTFTDDLELVDILNVK